MCITNSGPEEAQLSLFDLNQREALGDIVKEIVLADSPAFMYDPEVSGFWNDRLED